MQPVTNLPIVFSCKFGEKFGANERHSGESEPPYDELRRQWDAASANLTGDDPPGPEIVARAIADVIEADEPPLRVAVGDEAEMIVAVRTCSDDATFEATMRETLGRTWLAPPRARGPAPSRLRPRGLRPAPITGSRHRRWSSA